jgi:predicted phage terminase large subunit-like protein
MTTPTFRLTDRQREANAVLAGPQRATLLAGGARSGKTFLLTRAIVVRALRSKQSRHAFLRFRQNAVRASIWLDTLPKVMRLCFPGVKLRDQRQDGYTELPNGSQLWFLGLDDKERVEKVLGQEYATMYFGEATQIPLSSYRVAKTRLAQVCDGLAQREYVDLNPAGTGHWSYKQFIQKVDPETRAALVDPEEFASFFINPTDNSENLDPKFLRSLENAPERQRKRFFEGQFVSEIDGALWPLELIDRCRCQKEDIPELQRIVVAIDPSGTSGKDDKRSDQVGIVVAGKGTDGRAYVLDDLTCQLSPAAWGRLAVMAFHKHKADAIIAEENFGGAMVEHVIRTADQNIRYKSVNASRGKWVRAEPVSALYEQDMVRHAGRFPDLEDQMSNFSTAGYLGGKSPDRADALVWAMTDLMLGEAGGIGIF